MEFISFLFKLFIRIVIYALIFAALVWFLLDIGPIETWRRSVYNIGRIGSRLGGAVETTVDTAKDMKNVAGNQLQKAADRIDGKDPYEDFAKQLDERVRQDIQ